MTTRNNKEVLKFGKSAIYLNISGVIFSGLVFPVLSAIVCPQPQWQNPELYIDAYHPLQTATFFCGYFLVIGSLLTFIALNQLAKEETKIWAYSALIINVVFTSIVFINYIIQTTYVPYLAKNNPAETEFVLATFSMSNPGSFAWALEMYGWGGIGLSFIFMARIFKNSGLEKVLKKLFVVNGICSVAAAIITSVDMNWLFGPSGFASLIIWNLLVLIVDLVLLKYFRQKEFDLNSVE
jgi:hypothetical protein